MKIEQAIELAQKSGFNVVKRLNLSALEFLPEVREMCRADRCRAFGKSWRCPPACGSLEDIAEKVKHFNAGIIVQMVGDLEDEFDFEGMQNASIAHKESLLKLVEVLRDMGEEFLPMSAGTCTICEKCTYPDQPCRFPDKSFSSMEAYGLWVSKVCEKSDVKYNYGSDKIAYTGCILFNE